jgi:hypothetical protein
MESKDAIEISIDLVIDMYLLSRGILLSFGTRCLSHTILSITNIVPRHTSNTP